MNQAGKCAHCLHGCVSVLDKVGIGEQNKSIATGLFHVIPNLKSCGNLEHLGILDLVTSPRLCKTPNYTFAYRSGVVMYEHPAGILQEWRFSTRNNICSDLCQVL